MLPGFLLRIPPYTGIILYSFIDIPKENGRKKGGNRDEKNSIWHFGIGDDWNWSIGPYWRRCKGSV